MSFLPIVDRELRARARWPSTYRARFVGAVIAILAAGWLLLMNTGSAGGAVGLGMFETLAWLTFLYCLSEGVRNTADCLSEEKRAGTLGLLFLTDLRGYDVVLGKLIATSLNGAYALLALFPPMSIPLVLGGVTGGEVSRVALALVVALLFSLSIGIAVSASVRLEHRAWAATTLWLGASCALAPLGWVPFGPIRALALFSPASLFIRAFDASYRAEPGRYWAGVGVLAMGVLALLALASFILPRAWQEDPTTTASPRARRDGSEAARAAAIARRRQQLAECAGNPLVWLGARAEAEVRHVRLIICAVVGVMGLLAFFALDNPKTLIVAVAGLGMVAHFFLSVEVAFFSARFFSDARQSGALELLLCTPMQDWEIVEGHLLALRRLFTKPVRMLVIAEGAVLGLGMTFWCVADDASAGLIIVALLIAAWFGVVLTDLHACAWYGMWLGLKSRKTMPAFLRTVGYVLLVPLALGFCVLPIWPIIGWIKNYLLIDIAKSRLRKSFRAIVTGELPDSTVAQLEPRWMSRRAGSESRLPSVLPKS